LDIITKGIASAKKINAEKRAAMNNEEALIKSKQLIEGCSVAMVGSVSDSGYPNIKAMFKIEADGIRTVWFSTNTSSARVSQFRENPKACVYFHDPENFQGLMLVGRMDMLSDLESKRRLWREGWEVYYPLGVMDPDYSVLRFTARSCNYYHGLQNISFEIR
jgi:general stress protein 26